MFVRDNTACPFCGKKSAFDVYLDDTDCFDDAVLLRAECFECMSFTDLPVSYETLRYLFWEMSLTLPCSDPRSRVRRWSRNLFSRRSFRHYWKAIPEFLGRGLLDLQFVEHRALSSLCDLIVRPSGNPVLRIPEFLDLYLEGFRALPQRPKDHSTLGQPLAS